jgi:alpha-ketoglutarate-dependent 2,4-dichlorophenoxyacetate dioxygenase
MNLKKTALHPRFGLEVHHIDLRDVTAENLFADIRLAFEQHTLLLFRNQSLDDESHLRLAGLFGPVENRDKGDWGVTPSGAGKLSNRMDDKKLATETDMHLLHLRANQLWHTDSTFLPVPAVANILSAEVVSSSGGETELVSTRAAWKDMPSVLKEKTRDAIFYHRYAHSRAKIDPELAKEELYTMWADQAWRAVWPNPVTGDEALYIASHVFAVEGLETREGQTLIDQLTEFATQDKYVYSHSWQPGDVLIWDERATLHRGRPWPYNEERTLVSLCVSATEGDGLKSMRPSTAGRVV